MAHFNCPKCGCQITEQDTVCPQCGVPIFTQPPVQGQQYEQHIPNYNNQGQMPPQNNNNNKYNIIIALLVVIALGLLLGIILTTRSCNSGNNTVTVVDTTRVVEKIKYIPQATHAAEPQEYIPDVLDEYEVISATGRGVYLRYRPSERAKTTTIYHDYTRFLGAPSSTPGYIMVIRNGHIIGYMPEEKVQICDGYGGGYAQ